MQTLETKENTNNKILIFGNGIPQNFNYEEYNSRSLIKKFRDGLDFSIKTKTGLAFMGSKFQKALKEIAIHLDNLSEFNESVFWDIWNVLSVAFFEEDFRVYQNKYKEDGFDSGKELHKKIMDLIKRKEWNNTTPANIRFLFLNAYKWTEYGMQKSILINKDHTGWINIDYQKEFICWLENFDRILTTNYFTDLERYSIAPGYLHGNITNVKKTIRFWHKAQR